MDQEETYDLPLQARVIEEPIAAAEADGEPWWQVTLYAAWVAQLIAMMAFCFVMPFLPFFIRQELHVAEHAVPIWAGVVATSTGIAMTAAAPLWGLVADRYGRKLMVQRAMYGGAVVMALMGYVTNVHQLLILRFVQGAVTGTVSASVALVSSVTPRNRMGYALGLMQMAVFTGASLGPWMGGIMADHFGFRWPFLLTAGMLVFAGLLVQFGTRERFRRPAPGDAREDRSVRFVMCLPGVGTLLMVYFMLNLGGTIVAPIFPLFVAKIMGTYERAASQTGMIIAIGGGVAAITAVVIGRVSDRIGYRGILVASTTLAGLLCFPQAAAVAVWQLLVLRVFAGMAAGGMSPTANALVAGLVPRRCLGSVYGLTTAAASLGASLGPLIGGFMAASMGLRMPFVVMGAMLLALSVMVQLRVREPALDAALDNGGQ